MVENGSSVTTEESAVLLLQNGSRNGYGDGSAVTAGSRKAIVVLGAQWGDEGKGKLVDLLVYSEKGGMNVCRCQVSSASRPL